LDDSEQKPTPNDSGWKSSIVFVTGCVLLYPIAFVLFYPELGSFWNVSQEVAFGVGAAVVILINVLVVALIRDHLHSVQQRKAKAMGVFEGIASAQGGDAPAAVSKALESVELLLSWRYLYGYIGPVIVVLYGLLIVWGFANLELIRNQFEESWAPLTGFFGNLTLFVLLYYVLSFFVRWLARKMVEPLLERNGSESTHH
jgi:hypothetical protein